MLICSGHLGLRHLVSLNFFFFFLNIHVYNSLSSNPVTEHSYNTCNTLSSPGPETKTHWKWKCFDIIQGNSDSVVNHCCSRIHRSPYFCWVCKTGSLVDRTNTYEPKHRSGDLRDKYQRLPVKGDFVSEVPLSYEPVDNIITHVGFSSFHAFNIYAAFGWIKVVLQHWSRWWILPKEFISNLFPETWNGAIVCIRACVCVVHGKLGQISLHEGNKTSNAAQIKHVCLTYLLDSPETFCTAPDRSWNQTHEHPSSCHQKGNTFCPQIQAQPLWRDRCPHTKIM